MFRFLILIALVIVLTVPHAFAQEGEGTASEPAAEAPVQYELNKDEIKKSYEKAQDIKARTEELKQEMTGIMEGKSLEEKQHFLMAYNSHNIIETVRIVQKDVKAAVKECGKNNPDLKGKLDNRYKEWDGAVAPILKEAQANLDNMIVAQDYADKKKIKAIFSKISKVREQSNDQIDKIPVSTPEACGYLYDKMEGTQEGLTKMLQATLVTMPQAYSKSLKDSVEERQRQEVEKEKAENSAQEEE